MLKASVIVAALAASFVAMLPAMAESRFGVAEVQQRENAFAARLNAADVEGALRYYAADATVLPAGAPAASGHAAIRAFWTVGVKEVQRISLTTLSVMPLAPDVVQEIGSIKMFTREATPKPIAAKYVVIWRKTASGWQIATDIWNENG